MVSFEDDVIPAETITGFVPKKGAAQDDGAIPDSITCPEKPPRLATETVAFALVPLSIVSDDVSGEIM